MKKVIITISLLLLTVILGAQEMPLSSYYFYVAVYREDVKWVQKHLEAGYNPNKCRGEAGWYDSKPLKVLVEQLIGAYKPYTEGSVVIYPSIEVFKSLTKYGVNVNQLPYVWDRIHKYDNAYLNRILKYDKDKLTAEDTNKKDEIQDINRLLEALLEVGADPNMKGHPFPFGKSKKLLFFTDKKTFKYFNSSEATTPLYEAIKKGIQWESQVDLLLKYGAAVDESCLEAAKLSGEEAMVEKIQKLFDGVK
ncbi:hypothetical protein HRI96_05510 [Treponema parvum]|uniref:Ankyrin repeat domain-containing protein n=1 Tax=Treponema parvum TaxID=138851 RepID=A0A975IC70_9SPIR|nr:hypothetical protein [Treponema parvum]QTQ11701.1 hypothetical protein HRI96_05510 [Treponema parvum]